MVVLLLLLVEQLLRLALCVRIICRVVLISLHVVRQQLVRRRQTLLRRLVVVLRVRVRRGRRRRQLRLLCSRT